MHFYALLGPYSPTPTQGAAPCSRHAVPTRHFHSTKPIFAATLKKHAETLVLSNLFHKFA